MPESMSIAFWCQPPAGRAKPLLRRVKLHKKGRQLTPFFDTKSTIQHPSFNPRANQEARRAYGWGQRWQLQVPQSDPNNIRKLKYS